MKKLIVAAQFLLLLGIAAGGRAANIYVSPAGTGDGSIGSPAHLQAALDLARTNGQDDILLLQASATPYAAISGAFTYSSLNNDNMLLVIQGGWDATYTTQNEDPTLTVLDGAGVRRVLDFPVTHAGKSLDVTVENLTISNGYTPSGLGWGSHGAGIRCYTDPTALPGVAAATRLTVENCRFVSNRGGNATSGGGWGGGIVTNGPAEISDSEFDSNVTYGGGAGIYFVYPPNGDKTIQALVERCDFKNNYTLATAYYGGAAIYSYIKLTMVDTLVEGRTNPDDHEGGSAVWSAAGSHVTIDSCIFRNNKVWYWAGALGLWDAGAVITNTLFVGNKAGTSHNGAGGAIDMLNNSGAPETVVIDNCTFSGNRTLGYEYGQDYDGGNLWNRANYGGGATQPMTLTISNTIFADNEPSQYHVAGGGTTTLYNSLFDTAWEWVAAVVDGGGNHPSTNPLFEAGDEYFHIQAGSPCVDAGSNARVPAGITADFEGEPRIFAVVDRNTPVVDIGWDEYFDGSVEITSPAAGAVWLNDGAVKTVAWECSYVPGNLRLFLWQGPQGGGTQIAEIAGSVPCANETVDWAIPADVPDAADYAVVAVSETVPNVAHGVGPIAIQHLKLNSPNGGQSFTQGTTYPITWASGNLPGALIRIALYNGAALSRTIATGAANTGTFSWKVPYTQLPGTAYKIRLSTTSPLAAEDWSDANFKIVPAVTLTAPNGGQRWKRGTTQTIAWTYKNSPGGFVKIELYKNGVFNRTIATKIPVGTGGRGSYRWTIPATQTPATTYTVRVRSVSYANCFDFSNRAFTITR